MSDTDKTTKSTKSTNEDVENDEDDEDDESNENDDEDSEDSENSVCENSVCENKEELILPSNEEKNTENTCEANSGELEADKVSRKKTKQQKKAQKLEKRAKQKAENKEELITERKIKASVISTERLLTDKDFRKIDVALAKQEITYAKCGVKRTHDKIEKDQGGELVKLSDIENIYKKRKHDKAARQESVKVRIKCYILMQCIK